MDWIHFLCQQVNPLPKVSKWLNENARIRVQARRNEIYLPSLKALIDVIFQEASKKDWTWFDLADRSGLRDSTVRKLGHYETQYPQFRTIQLLCYAVGGHVELVRGAKSPSFKVTWTPESFNKRGKKMKRAA